MKCEEVGKALLDGEAAHTENTLLAARSHGSGGPGNGHRGATLSLSTSCSAGGGQEGELNVTVEGGPGRRLCTHRDAGVLVQDDLQQMWGENGWRFKPFLWFGHVGLLVVGSWWGTGQLCWETVKDTYFENEESRSSLNLRHRLVSLVSCPLNTDSHSPAGHTGPRVGSRGREKAPGIWVTGIHFTSDL